MVSCVAMVPCHGPLLEGAPSLFADVTGGVCLSDSRSALFLLWRAINPELQRFAEPIIDMIMIMHVVDLLE